MRRMSLCEDSSVLQRVENSLAVNALVIGYAPENSAKRSEPQRFVGGHCNAMRSWLLRLQDNVAPTWLTFSYPQYRHNAAVNSWPLKSRGMFIQGQASRRAPDAAGYRPALDRQNRTPRPPP